MPAHDAGDEQISRFFRSFLPDFYFVNTPLSRMRRHLYLLRALPANPLQIELHSPPAAQFTELMLCGYDRAQPGLLAQSAGALSALGVNVHTAWIHTLRDPHLPGETNAKVVLDTLILSENSFHRTRPLTARSCEAVKASLRAAIESEKAPDTPAMPPLQLRELSVTPAQIYTLVRVSAPNESGVLHQVSQAIARLNLDIAHAQINTFENAVADTFFVTDAAGLSLSERECSRVAEQLSALLSG